jgi:histidinol-phosphatase (PHP family)
MLTSYHNHTNWSDGVCTLDEQIEGARKAGLDELGISDHYIMHPSGRHIRWSMPLERLPDYIDAVSAAARSHTDPVVRLGIEADYFPETIDRLREVLAAQPFDYVIGSVHYVDGFCVDEAAKLWAALSKQQCNEVWSLYWQRVKELAQSKAFDIMAHLDLPKIFDYKASSDLMPNAREALDAIAEAGMAIEINTRGWQRPCKEAYPSRKLLGEARRREIPLMINADAHRPDELTRGFEEARQMARESGYTETVLFEKRRMRSVPL